jgi:formate dehydrogenase subunit gamma
MTGVAPAAGLDVVQAVDLAVAAHRDDEGPLIEVLHSVQAELGWVPKEATRLVADRLNLSRAEVHGVVTFYTDFRERPPAAHQVRVCAAEACQARGSRDLVDVAEQRLGLRLGEQSPDGTWELDKVFCLGNCALGPSAEVDGVTYGRVDAARLDSAIARAETSGAPA